MVKAVEELRMAIEGLYRCQAVHNNSAWVVGEVGEKIVWEGIVETFTLKEHDPLNRCFAWWNKTNDGKTRFISVPESHAVVSPLAAFKAALNSGDFKP